MRRSRWFLALGVWCKQGTYQGQLGLNARVAPIELQRLAVGLTGQFSVHVTQVFMGGGVTGVSPDGHLKRSPGFVKLALTGVEHGQVVVGLRQLRVVLGDLREGGDGVQGLGCFGLDHAFDKAHLRIARLASKILVSLGECFSQLASAYQNIHIGVVICVYSSN